MRRKGASDGSMTPEERAESISIAVRTMVLTSLNDAVKAERERCAKMAEHWRYELWAPENVGGELARTMRK